MTNKKIIKAIFIVIISIIFQSSLYAQKYTVNGYIEDSQSGEKLTGAVVWDTNNNINATIGNNYGYYSLTIPSGKIKLTCASLGYTHIIVEFDLNKDTTINFSLIPDNEIEQIDVSAERSEVESTQMSQNKLSIETIKTMPVLLGETDVLKAIQLLPGVQSGGEGTSGIYVRGGGADQNLILLDGVPVYNVNHLFGFFSVFNADAINDVSIIKGGFPAHYGGRLSSVLDIRMKEGNSKKIAGAVSVGLISSKFTIEGPIQKEKTSFIISGRRTYIDILAAPLIYAAAKQYSDANSRGGYFFYDLNAKINHKISEKDRIYLSAYTGKDKAYTKIEESWQDELYKTDFDLHWGNLTTALRWNRVINPKLFSNTTLTYSRYSFVTDISESEEKISTKKTNYEYSLGYLSGIEDYGAKVDFDYRPAPRHNIKFGLNATRHIFKPGITAEFYNDEQYKEKLDTTFGSTNINGDEFALYLEDELKITQKIKANIGLHFSGFAVENSFYTSLQPRISTRYMVSDKLSFKLAYSEMAQYLHLLTNSSVGLPTDLWLPTTDKLKPQKSKQIAAGTAIKINKMFSLSIESYYKTMENLIEYKEGASFFDNFTENTEGTGNSWEKNIETGGKGWSYGVEFLLKKTVGKTTGWIGYTWSKTDRQFANISFGEKFPYKYDRRNDINIVISHKFNEHIDIGAVWVYGTGNAISLALEKYAAPNGNYSYGNFFEYDETGTVNYYESRNNYRMPAYHRLDLNVNVHKTKKRGEQTWSYGLYNAYNNKNPFFLMFGRSRNTGKPVLNQYSLFPIIPSISYKFVF